MTHLRSLGITGGIGSGKSSVAREFKRLGAKIFHADLIAAASDGGQPLGA